MEVGNTEVEMEDAAKQQHDLRNSIDESEGKVLDSKIENKAKEFPCTFTFEGYENKSEMENQNGGSTTGIHISTKCVSEERSSTKNNAEDQTSAQTTDSKDEVVEQCAANSGLEEENSDENGAEAGNAVKNIVEENPIGDVSVEKSKDAEKQVLDCVDHVERKEMATENVDSGSDPRENNKFQTELSSNEATQVQDVTLDQFPQSEDQDMEDAANAFGDKVVNDESKHHKEILLVSPATDGNAKTVEAAIKCEGDDSCLPNQHQAAEPNSLVIDSLAIVGDPSRETVEPVFAQVVLRPIGEGDDGTPEDQATFMRELESFHLQRAMDFKPPKFYGQPLNCLKLWRAVIQLGGYDKVTGSKLWRQVGESFHPPKTCTTVSWTFRIFYEKSLLEYERHKRQIGDLLLPVATLPEASAADSEENGYQESGSGSGSGRARRYAAARAMQGWHVQRLFDNDEVGEPVIKDKNINSMVKRENNTKSIGSLKQKRPSEVEHPVKAARTDTSRQLATSVVDIGPPADWVKINVRQAKHCFEVYALVPGLLREEVRVQSDPAGRLVITGQPGQVENPWGITQFKKVISLPARINPLQTSAVISLHGRLFVRVPFEQSNV